MGLLQRFNRVMGVRMAASGRVAMLETTGRRSGRPVRTPVGYVRLPDGAIWLGAGRPEAHWPRNLLADPRCRVELGGEELACVAEPLEGEVRAAAVAAIHARYGAPAARVGQGPVFVLRPVDEAAGAAA